MTSSFPVFGTSPLFWALVLLVLLALTWRVLPRALRGLGIVAGIVLVALMTPMGAQALERMVSANVPPPDTCAAPTPRTIVVLGSGFSEVPESGNDYGAMDLEGLQRLFAGVALWRRIPDARLVIAGGGGARIPESAAMANLAMQMGVPAPSINIEARSRNTWENAKNVSALSPPVPRRIWLVTSLSHLPRATRAFQAFGFQTCAWPAVPPPTRWHVWAGGFVPQGRSVRRSAIALHEMIGGVVYSLRERRREQRAPAAAGQTP